MGLAGAGLAVLPGLADWSTTQGGAKRVGFVHGMLNMAVASLYAFSLVARRGGRRGLGVALSSSAFGLLLGSAWLGRELSYSYGVGFTGAGQERDEEAFAQGDTGAASRQVGPTSL